MIYDAVILGAGISGLSAAKFLKLGGIEPLIIEKNSYAGGKAHTERTADFVIEEGPNGFLDNKPDTLELAEKSLLNPDLLRANDKAEKRFIFSGGRLHELPFSPAAFIKSPLLSFGGKLRLAAEPFVRKKYEDETLADFVKRRFGKEALNKLIGPMATGVYAGDPDTMSVESAFGRIKELERNYGSLFKALIKLKKSSNAAAFGGGRLTSFTGGLSQMVGGISKGIGIRLNCRALLIRKDEKLFIVETDSGEIKTKRLISALPAYTLAKIAVGFDKELAETADIISYAPVDVAAFGYNRKLELDGFGFLFALDQMNSAIGVLWDSSIFPRAAAGHSLIRIIIGGARLHHMADKSDEEIINIAKEELKRTMNLNVEPDLIRIIRHKKAIPQYLMNHKDIVKIIDEKESRNKGLKIIGNAFRGIGLNDCVSAGKKAALSMTA